MSRPQSSDQLELEFAVNVVLDLLSIGWVIRLKGGRVVLLPPALEKANPAERKALVRQGHLIERDAQLGQKSVIEFVRKMERRHLTSTGWHSVFSLMRDGSALACELKAIDRLTDRTEKLSRLSSVVSPYLQLVTEDGRCPHTGLRLRDIWRYFRHTWVNAYKSLPGRSMMLLVRDAAAPNHPVVGIAALGSAIAQQKVRDEWIGRDQDTFLRELVERPSEDYARWVLESLDSLLKAIYLDDLVAQGVCHLIDIEYPTDHVIDRLIAEGTRAIDQHRLYSSICKTQGPTGGGRGDGLGGTISQQSVSEQTM